MSTRTALRLAFALVALTLAVLAVLHFTRGEAVPAVSDGTFTLAEVREGDDADRCLVAIGSSVYDLSAYAVTDERIRPLCGTEATQAMAAIGTSTQAMFAPLKVGTVVEEAP